MIEFVTTPVFLLKSMVASIFPDAPLASVQGFDGRLATVQSQVVLVS